MNLNLMQNEFGFEKFHVGRYNSQENNALIIRALNYGRVEDKLSIGQLKSYKTIACSLLLHISKDYNTTEEIKIAVSAIKELAQEE